MSFTGETATVRGTEIGQHDAMWLTVRRPYRLRCRSAAVRLTDSWNVAAGWLYKPEPIESLIVNPGQIACLRYSMPNDPITLNGTLVLQECGYAA